MAKNHTASQRAAGARPGTSVTRPGSKPVQAGSRPNAATAASPAAQTAARDHARAAAASRIPCARMPGADLATSFWADNNDLVTAVVAIALALLLVAFLRPAFASRGRRLAEAVNRGELSPEIDTRLRL